MASKSSPALGCSNSCNALDSIAFNSDGMKTDDNRCRDCGTKLIGKNAIDVGYCIPCFHRLMVGSFDEPEEDDFEPCNECDRIDACADFGCAIKAGIFKPYKP